MNGLSAAVLGFILALLVPAVASAATLKVAVGGEDTGDCVAGPCASIGYAVGQAEAGDVVEVGEGVLDRSLDSRQ